jgi:hypothetical protein
VGEVPVFNGIADGVVRRVVVVNEVVWITKQGV